MSQNAMPKLNMGVTPTNLVAKFRHLHAHLPEFGRQIFLRQKSKICPHFKCGMHF